MRTTIIRERTREIQRVEKLMEDTGVKLSSVASEVHGVSARIMLEALVAGERDPVVLADMAKGRLRSKIPQLTEALTGRCSEHHAFLVQIQLDLIDQRAKANDEITERIEVVMAPFHHARDLMSTIPGISTKVADVIIAETGADRTVPYRRSLGLVGGSLSRFQ
jgi:transposase